MKRKSRGFVPIVVFFAVLNAFFITGKDMLARWGADRDVLILGNCLIFIITLASFMIAFKGLNHTNPNVFMRSVMASIMIKMFLLVIAAFAYISIYKKGLNKPALFICMGLYLVYTFIEVSVLTKMLKQKSNG
jgi:hypothetical protein